MAQQPHFSVSIVTPPDAEPIDVREAATWLRVDDDQDDDTISALVQAARELVETETGRALMPTTFLASFDRFPLAASSQYSPGNPNALTPMLQNTWPLDQSAWAILLPRSPVLSVSSVKYYDTAGVLQTMSTSDYVVDITSEPGRITPASGGYWPSCQWRPNAVKVTFVAGYADAASVPQSIKTIVRLLLGGWYENRAAVGASLQEQPLAVQSLIAANRVAAVW